MVNLVGESSISLKDKLQTFKAVPPEVIDGADVILLAGLGFAYNASAGAFASLRAVFSHKYLPQLQYDK